jgi:hypothetical protein
LPYRKYTEKSQNVKLSPKYLGISSTGRSSVSNPQHSITRKQVT